MPATPIEVLAAGAQAQSGASAALDVSAYSRITLDLAADCDRGAVPPATLRVAIETGPSSSGPWRSLLTRIYRAGRGQPDIQGSPDSHAEGQFPTGADRFSLGGFDNYLRVSWSETGDALLGGTTRDPGLVLGLTGEAL